jgi:hypothetical protein
MKFDRLSPFRLNSTPPGENLDGLFSVSLIDFPPLDLFSIVKHFFFLAVTPFGYGSTAHTTPSALAASRCSHFNALFAHVFEDQINGTDGNSQDDESDNDCKDDRVRMWPRKPICYRFPLPWLSICLVLDLFAESQP